MKISTLLTLALAAPAFAGTSSKEVLPPPVEPCLAQWFAGGSIGYLTELEEPMYHLHVGQDTCAQFAGWDFAWFLEVGYTDKDESYNRVSTAPPNPMASNTFDLDQLEQYLAGNAGVGQWGYDLSIIPVTLNGKLERELSENLNCYVGAGLGFSNVDLDVNAGAMGVSDDDWVFTFQAFAGLNYDFSPSCELYGGVRWIYFDDADIGPFTLELDDDILLEVGARYNF